MIINADCWDRVSYSSLSSLMNRNTVIAGELLPFLSLAIKLHNTFV